MPFDGTELPTPTIPNNGLFSPLSKHYWRLWFESPAYAPLGPDRDAAVVRLLQDARRLIEDPRNWTSGRYRSLSGRHCAVGALRAAARRLDDPRIALSAHALLIKVAGSRGFTDVEKMNDRSCHAAVLGAFDEAIAAALIAEAFTQAPVAVG
jgi:hypothetical protein